MTIAEARAHIGERVVYHPACGHIEDGVITRVSGDWVFVRYGADRHAVATDSADLTPRGDLGRGPASARLFDSGPASVQPLAGPVPTPTTETRCELKSAYGPLFGASLNESRTRAAEATFRALLDELGADLLEPSWRGSHVPHRVRCPVGHDCFPRPTNVQMGEGLCGVCGKIAAGRTQSARAWAKFRTRIEELGGTVLETEWLGSSVSHRVICPEGHKCYLKPCNLIPARRGVCRVCSGRDPVAVWAAFRQRVEAMGGRVLEPGYLGSGKPHHVRCSQGHDCYPAPGNVRQGNGICKACAGQDASVAWAQFRTAVAACGGTVLESEWLGSQTPHHVRCREGHDCYPWPTSVQRGIGICRMCVGKIYDAFYVVAGARSLKFGVTSGDPRPRLRDHRRDGYDSVKFLRTDMGAGAAWDLEKKVKVALFASGYTPVKGAEYFPIETLPLLLRLVDESLASGVVRYGDAKGAQATDPADLEPIAGKGG